MILGSHTLDETRDQLAIADYRFKDTGIAFDAMNPKPVDIQEDWFALKAKWAKARKEIADALTGAAVRGFPLPSNAIRTEDEYKKVLGFIQFQEQDPKSLQSITRRIESATGKQILYPEQPRGDFNTDIDGALFKNLDATTKDLDAASEAAKKGAENAAFSPTGLMIGGSIIATIVALHYIKKL